MPKSRRRRKKPQPQTTTRTIKLHPRAVEALERQLERFRKKFGREPGPNDPVFFDPDCNVPTPLSEAKIEAKVLEAMLEAGTSPEYAYAYRKTGLLSFGGDQTYWHPDDRREWADAVAEYLALEQDASEAPEKH
jgi:hypothetical protein